MGLLNKSVTWENSLAVFQLILVTKRLKKLTTEVLTLYSAIAVESCRRLPSPDVKMIGLINIREKADEPFEAFLSQLMEIINKMVP